MKKAIATAVILFLTAGLFAEAGFSGYSGGKVNYSSNENTEKYDPDLTLQAFFQGQFNISQNMWSRLEFSLDTADFISSELFHETMAAFKIDELSLTFKSHSDSDANYFSLFMGIYDPIGSDIFLQR